MRVAVVDDDAIFCAQLCQYLAHYPAADDPLAVRLFQSGEQLWFAYGGRPQPFDLIFLDIEMAGMGGMEVARKIRRQGDDVFIVLITNHVQYALSGYEVRAYRYLLKPISAQILFALLDEIRRERVRSWSEYLHIKVAGQILHLPYQGIYYLESRSPHVLVYWKGERLQLARKLGELLPVLDDRFAQTHKSYLINLYYLQWIDKGFKEVCLYGCDHRLPVSKRYRRSFVAHVNQFNLDHGHLLHRHTGGIEPN